MGHQLGLLKHFAVVSFVLFFFPQIDGFSLWYIPHFHSSTIADIMSKKAKLFRHPLVDIQPVHLSLTAL